MIADASDPNGLTFHDIAKTRNRVEKAMINNPTHRLDFAHNKIALGEASLVIGVLGLGEGDDLTKVSVWLLVLWYRPNDFSILARRAH